MAQFVRIDSQIRANRLILANPFRVPEPNPFLRFALRGAKNCCSRRYAERIWGEFFYFGPANFAQIAGEFLSEFWWRILIANFSALFFQGFRPPRKFTPKIHVQNCRHSSPISLSWTQNLFTAIFCLRGRPKIANRNLPLRGSESLRTSEKSLKTSEEPLRIYCRSAGLTYSSPKFHLFLRF